MAQKVVRRKSVQPREEATTIVVEVHVLVMCKHIVAPKTCLEVSLFSRYVVRAT